MKSDQGRAVAAARPNVLELLRAKGIDTDALRCSEAEWQAAKDKTAALARRVHLPPNWKEVTGRLGPEMEGARAYACTDGRSVILSAGKHDGKWWLHASVSRPKAIPSYWDLADLKAIFIGPDLQAIQVFPRVSEHVNLHPNCLHLWAALDPEGDGLPEFGAGGTI